jgi:hypothetical protein
MEAENLEIRNSGSGGFVSSPSSFPHSKDWECGRQERRKKGGGGWDLIS